MKKFKWLEQLKDKLNQSLKSRKNASSEDLASESYETEDYQAPSSGSRRSLLQSLSEEATINIQRASKLAIKPPLENYYPYLLGALLGYMGADASLTAVRPLLLPDSTPSIQKQKQMRFMGQKILADYSEITKRNPFNSDGVIPPPINQKNKEQQDEIDGPASLSRLPLKLLGTIVHINPAKSVASIEARAGQTSVLPYIPNDDIQGLAKLLKVERQKAFFRNLSNKRIEYIEMKIEGDLTFGRPPGGGDDIATGIKKDGNNFTVSKTELKKQLANLSQLLQQARAMPYNDPYTGEMQGFKIVDIKPGSIFEKLVSPGDIIKEVNGTKVDSMARAMELYKTLKDSANVKMTVERNGRDEVLDYNIQ